MKFVSHSQNGCYGDCDHSLHHSVVIAAKYGQFISRVYHIDHLLFLSSVQGKQRQTSADSIFAQMLTQKQTKLTTTQSDLSISDYFRFRREDRNELLDRQHLLVATIWRFAMPAHLLYVIVMPNTDVRSVRIAAESVAGKNESHCESGHEYLHRGVHFGGRVRLRGIQRPNLFRQHFNQFFAIVG